MVVQYACSGGDTAKPWTLDSGLDRGLDYGLNGDDRYQFSEA